MATVDVKELTMMLMVQQRYCGTLGCVRWAWLMWPSCVYV